MVEQVNNLIYNVLADGRDLHLPEVGSLVVVRRSAQRTSSSQIVPPSVAVSFTGEARGVSLVDVIARTADVTTERAGRIYRQWLSHSRKDGVLTIAGVGVIKNRKFMTEQEFGAAIAPEGSGARKIQPRKNRTLYIILALCLLALLGVAGYFVWAGCKPEPVVVPEPAPEPVVEEVVAPKPVLPEGVFEMTEGNFYAVFGVYSQLENARADVLRAKRLKRDVNPVIFSYDGRYMVALMDTADRRECVRYVESLRAFSDHLENVWVYTNNK